MASDGSGSSSIWSRDDDKAFENALATYPEDSVDRWENILADVPGKSLEEIKHHYDLLVDDVDRIESGLVPLPCYKSSSDRSANANHVDDEGTGKKGGSSGPLNSDSNHGGKGSRSDQERRKGIAWTEEEHKNNGGYGGKLVPGAVNDDNLITTFWSGYHILNCGLYWPVLAWYTVKFIRPEDSELFLLGLDKYGKGDWRSISRNFVKTRTPTQVASHAQKYFNRLNSTNKDRRRSSIHDITSVEGGDISVPQVPITGQTTNGSSAAGGGSSGKSGKQSPQAPPAPSAVGMYGGTTIGQPVGGPLVSAVGTPVNLPPQAHMAFGVRAPVPGSVVPGAPMNMYPMAHPSAHR
ncbi:hypothetical protein LguiB_025421 [Lonicera macranthoides]